MIDLNHLDTIANRLSDLLPPALYLNHGRATDFSLKMSLQAGLANWIW